MTHTNEFLRGMFAAYMGCEVTTKYDEDGRTYKTVGISFDEGNLQVQTSKGDTDWWNIPICKPILTPLSEITDDDAVEVAKICAHLHTVEAGKRIVSDIMYYSPINHLHIIDYLRSRHYDCGYMHIPSLIDAGLAINSQIKNQKLL